MDDAVVVLKSAQIRSVINHNKARLMGINTAIISWLTFKNNVEDVQAFCHIGYIMADLKKRIRT